jgi:hypothetical protein
MCGESVRLSPSCSCYLRECEWSRIRRFDGSENVEYSFRLIAFVEFLALSLDCF